MTAYLRTYLSEDMLHIESLQKEVDSADQLTGNDESLYKIIETMYGKELIVIEPVKEMFRI